MPTLFILAGPNGAGKTTFYYQAIEDGFIKKDLPFINVDTVARYLPGGYTEENFVKASDITRERIAGYIARKEDFMIESNLAKTADYDWIENMKKTGYDVILYFLCTKGIEVNIDRVERRVKEGGHFIPPHIITDRFNLCLIYLKTKLSTFKQVYLIDNTEETVDVVAELQNGKIVTEAPELPHWVDNLLFIVKKLNAGK